MIVGDLVGKQLRRRRACHEMMFGGCQKNTTIPLTIGLHSTDNPIGSMRLDYQVIADAYFVTNTADLQVAYSIASSPAHQCP